MKEENHIDNLFYDKLRSFEKQPPEEVWNNISGNLKQGRRKVVFITGWKIAAGFALILTMGLGWYYISDSKRDKEIIVARDTKGGDEIPSPMDELQKPGLNEASFPSAGTEKREDVSSFPEKKEQRIVTAGSVQSQDAVPEPASIFVPGKSEKNTGAVHFTLSSLPGQIRPPSAESDRLYRKKPKSSPSLDLLAYTFVEEETTSGEEKRQWQLSAMAAPEYSYRTVKDGTMATSSYFNNSESAKLSYSGGFQVGYQVSDRLNIQSGIVYSRSGIGINNLNQMGAVALAEYYGTSVEKTQKSVVNVGNSMGVIIPANTNLTYLSYNNTDEEYYRSNRVTSDNLAGNTLLQSPVDAELIQYFDFIELPLNLRYCLYDGKINFNILGGVSSNVLVGNKVVFISDGDRMESGTTQSIRTFNYSGNLGFSFDYELSDQFLLLFEPRYKQYLRSINQDELLDARPYMFGIFTGIRYRF